MYVDESGINTYIQREYARALKGEQIEDVKRGNRFERVNIIGAPCKGKRHAIQCCKQTAGAEFFESRFKDHILQETPNGCGVTQ